MGAGGAPWGGAAQRRFLSSTSTGTPARPPAQMACSDDPVGTVLTPVRPTGWRSPLGAKPMPGPPPSRARSKLLPRRGASLRCRSKHGFGASDSRAKPTESGKVAPVGLSCPIATPGTVDKRRSALVDEGHVSHPCCSCVEFLLIASRQDDAGVRCVAPVVALCVAASLRRAHRKATVIRAA